MLSLVLVGLLVLGVQYVGAGGSATVGGNSFQIYQCGILNESGTYYLNQSINNGTSDCLIIRNDSITIDGNGSRITGNVNASNATVDGDGNGGNAYTNLVLQNVTLNGSIASVGADGTNTGGLGGSINITNSNVTSIISVGGSCPRPSMGVSCTGGSSGTIIIFNSMIQSVSSIGGKGDYLLEYGGGSGAIKVYSSRILGIINSSGGGAQYSGGSGQILIVNSNATDVFSTGGEDLTDATIGGGSGEIILFNSNVTSIISTGGNGGNFGLPSGLISINHSTTGTIRSTGGQGRLGTDYSGEIFITNNSVTGSITTLGGNGLGDSGGSPSGTVVIDSSIINGAITSKGGDSGGAYYAGTPGIIKINDSVVNGTINSTGGWSGNGPSPMGNGGTLILTNVTFNGFNVSAGAEGDGSPGNVSLSWWLDTNTNSLSAMAVSNVNLSISNRTNGLVSSRLTSAGTVRQAVTEYFYNGTAYFYYSNYTVNASKSGFTNASTSVNMSTNRAISLTMTDLVAPVVTLSSPLTGASYSGSSYSVPFVWGATDSGVGVANCSIYANGVGYVNTSAITDTNNNQNISLSAGTYNAYINCTDYDGNTGNSSNITFTITAPAVESSGGTFSTPSASDTSLTDGVTRTLTAGTQFSFNFVADSGTREYHSLRVNNIYTNSAILTLYSTPIKFNITVGETKVFDTNGNGKNDLSVTLQSISFGRADVFVKKITESIVGNQTTTAGNNGNVVNQTSTNAVPETVPSGKGMSVTNIIEIIIGIIVLAIIILAVLIYKNKNAIRRGVKIRER